VKVRVSLEPEGVRMQVLTPNGKPSEEQPFEALRQAYRVFAEAAASAARSRGLEDFANSIEGRVIPRHTSRTGALFQFVPRGHRKADKAACLLAATGGQRETIIEL